MIDDQTGEDLGHWASIETVVAVLQERFPGVPLWFGRHTGRFWALVVQAGRPCLVEATTPPMLAEAITLSQRWPCPRR